MKILIIIPAYNEERNIEPLLNNLLSLKEKYDILVVNDASKDATSEIANRRGIKVADLPVNLGIGGAMQTGYLYSYYNNYDIAVQLDGDGQHDPQFLESIIAPIISGKADMVVGSRFIEKDGFQSTKFRRFGIIFFRKLIFLLTRQIFTDPTSGFRACNRFIIAHFALSYPYDYPEPETLVSICRRGFKLMEVPVVMRDRFSGQSSIRTFGTIYYMVKVTLAILMEVMRKNGRENYSIYGTQASSMSNYH